MPKFQRKNTSQSVPVDVNAALPHVTQRIIREALGRTRASPAQVAQSRALVFQLAGGDEAVVCALLDAANNNGVVL